MTQRTPPLGIIEGYFGPPWSWPDRTHVMRTLAPHGYDRFIYAPKADARLRRDWMSPHEADEAAAIRTFANACREENVSFGIGLSPFELHANWNAAGRQALIERVGGLVALGADHVAILFDDMRGDLDDLAAIQGEIVQAVADAHSVALTVCPSYYSDDPVLDRAFGARPEDYLADLAKALPPDVGMFWTGPEVCSRDISPGHLDRVAEKIGRKPALWDNYPVNDGPRMSQHLHLRGFTGRSGIAESCAAHFINPALQPHLGLLPALTLAMLYDEGGAYDYLAATRAAAHLLYPAELARALLADLLSLQDAGCERLNKERLTQKYNAFDHGAAAEVVGFLDGYYTITADEVQTQ